MLKTPIESKDLIPISKLVANGAIPISIHTTRDLCNRGVFPATKIGREWFSTTAAVRKWVAERTQRGANYSFRKEMRVSRR